MPYVESILLFGSSSASYQISDVSGGSHTSMLRYHELFYESFMFTTKKPMFAWCHRYLHLGWPILDPVVSYLAGDSLDVPRWQEAVL